jgi:RNA polymerase-binding transcription factor DksA
MSKPHDAAPPAPLTRAEISTLRRVLLAQQTALRKSASLPSVIREASARETDPSDEANESLAEDEALAESRHSRDRLADVEAALAQIEDGTYGTSELSGEPIGYARLSAVPWARLTVTEQEERDRASGSGSAEPAP